MHLVQIHSARGRNGQASASGQNAPQPPRPELGVCQEPEGELCRGRLLAGNTKNAREDKRHLRLCLHRIVRAGPCLPAELRPELQAGTTDSAIG